jgi:putative membrane protein
MRLLLRWAIVSFALFIADWLIPGIVVSGNALLVFVVTAAILGLLNAILRPILKFLSCPLILLTFGLFVFVLNGVMLWLSSVVAQRVFHVGFEVHGFGAAVLGAIVVSLVSVILTALLKDREKKE